MIARFPKTSRFRDGIASRVENVNGCRQHKPILGYADKIGTAHALAARHAVHVEQNDIDPRHAGVGGQEALRLRRS